ncbi:MAG TPA: hypothetical protein DCR43_07145 [Bacteroidales bacterium]|nr:MAG: hypothetical protein CVU06_06700 [Bacteroidetes bacterium HGW-Bacteroidetes-22]HAQ65609.1 hypothetical protein [Bacteroidales bacterium]HBZ66915.1 hypothetical protein [Bacteroidales bacterium]
MKKFLFVILGLALLAACGGNATSDASANADSSVVAPPVIDTTIVYSNVIIKVEGMTCTGCEKTIIKALRTTPGVADAAASWEAGIAKAQYDPAVATQDAIKAAIEAKGYKVASIELK